MKRSVVQFYVEYCVILYVGHNYADKVRCGVGSIMTRYRDDKGDETEEPFNSVHPNSSARIMHERRVEIIFLSPSRTADENNVGVGQEMVLPCPYVSASQERLVFFHSTRSSNSDKHIRERERREKLHGKLESIEQRRLQFAVKKRER